MKKNPKRKINSKSNKTTNLEIIYTKNPTKIKHDFYKCSSYFVSLRIMKRNFKKLFLKIAEILESL